MYQYYWENTEVGIWMFDDFFFLSPDVFWLYTISFSMMKKIRQIPKPWNLLETSFPASPHPHGTKCFCHVINSVSTRSCGPPSRRRTPLWNGVPENLTSALPFWRKQKADSLWVVGDGLHSTYISLWCGLKGRKLEHFNSPSLSLACSLYRPWRNLVKKQTPKKTPNSKPNPQTIHSTVTFLSLITSCNKV